MYYSVDNRISSAERYIGLGWWLVPVRGFGEKAKMPLFKGWPDYRPDFPSLTNILEMHLSAGIGVNLGPSGLVDLEADSDEGEKIVDDLCRGAEFPWYRSRRGKHRLFKARESVAYLGITANNIEFRAGRHQSILPPTVIGDTEYKWEVSPFDCPPPPLSQRILDFYAEHAQAPGNKTESRGVKRPSFPYRDKYDYILQNFDLLKEAANAGIEFVGNPDTNGNVPCFVPAIVRDNQDDDDYPSGVFNIFNGVLRDFATGTNHLFFRTLAALTGRPWQQIHDYYESKAGAAKGRPHSRRISVPSQHLSPPARTPLAEARADLERYYQAQLSRPPIPNTLHLIKGPPGVGKTYTLCKQLGEKGVKAIILTLENRLASTHDRIINDVGGGRARRMPVLRETVCPHPKEYEATSRRGFKPSQSFPCRQCTIGPRHCLYLLAFPSVNDAEQLCAAAIYHTHADFYASYGNKSRPVLVFDENCIDLLLEPVSLALDKWHAWAEMLRSYGNQAHVEQFLALIDWLAQAGSDFLNAKDEYEEPLKYQPHPVPDYLLTPGLKKSPKLEKWLNRSAHKKDYRTIHNLYNSALYLLTEPKVTILFERISRKDGDTVVVRFRKKNPLPEDKEVFILDATANEQLLRAIAPEWDLKVWDCPPIEQEGEVIQIMDYDVSRQRIKKEVQRYKPDNPSWLVQVLDQILEKYGPAPIISFKSVTENPVPEQDILGIIRNKDKISGRFNFPCRGISLEDETLIVLGTPYKDQASIWELALAMGGIFKLPRTEYRHRDRDYGYFSIRTMSHDDSHLRPIEDFLVSADLSQAVGRVRPLQRLVKVFVISNSPLQDWDIQQFMASELFNLRMPLRKDASDTYSRYVSAANDLLATGQKVSNLDVCKILGMAVRTGASYWLRFKQDYGKGLVIKGRKIRRGEDY